MKIRELLQEFAIAPGGDGDDEPDEEILRRLAAQWWNGTAQEMYKAEKTLAAMGWEIGEDEGYDQGGVFVIRAGDEHGKSYISWPHEELLDIQEAQPPGRYLTGKEKVKNISPVLTRPYGKAKQTTLMKNFFGSS